MNEPDDIYVPADDEGWINLAKAIVSDLSDCYSSMFYNSTYCKIDEKTKDTYFVDTCKSQEDYWKHDEPFYVKRMLLLKRFKKSPCSRFIREDILKHGLDERLKQNMRKQGIKWEAKR